MALLSDADRRALWTRIMDEAGRRGVTLGNLKKQDIRNTVDAVDQWIEDNTASFNAALPVAARTTMPAKQKAWLLTIIAERRFNLV